jgi:hypothetical protein
LILSETYVKKGYKCVVSTKNFIVKSQKTPKKVRKISKEEILKKGSGLKARIPKNKTHKVKRMRLPMPTLPTLLKKYEPFSLNPR